MNLLCGFVYAMLLVHIASVHGVEKFLSTLLINPEQPIRRICIKSSNATREQFVQEIYPATSLICCKRITREGNVVFIAKLARKKNDLIFGKHVAYEIFAGLKYLHKRQNAQRNSA